MKTKILVISTRSLFEENTIFEKSVISPEASMGLKKYAISFINRRINDLKNKRDDLKSKEKITQDIIRNIVQGDIKIVDRFLETKNADFFSEEEAVVKSSLTEELPQEAREKIYEIVDTYLADDSETINSDEDKGIQTWLNTIKEKLIKKIEPNNNDGNLEKNSIEESLRYILKYTVNPPGDSENKEFTFFEMQISDIDKFIDGCEAVNIDGEGLKMRDRVSLFKVAYIKEDDTCYYIYAVYPLGYPDNDEFTINEANEKKHKNSKWVNCITDAVIEKSNAGKNANTEIILLLHDKDLRTTEKMPFKTLYANKEDYENVKRTLTVYQHSSPFFNKIRTCIGDAKDIFTCAEKIIIDDLVFQYWKDISHKLASYKGKQDVEKLKEILKNFKGTGLENKYPSFETVINSFIEKPDDKEQFYNTIMEVNDSIRALRIMNT